MKWKPHIENGRLKIPSTLKPKSQKNITNPTTIPYPRHLPRLLYEREVSLLYITVFFYLSQQPNLQPNEYNMLVLLSYCYQFSTEKNFYCKKSKWTFFGIFPCKIWLEYSYISKFIFVSIIITKYSIMYMKPI